MGPRGDLSDERVSEMRQLMDAVIRGLLGVAMLWGLGTLVSTLGVVSSWAQEELPRESDYYRIENVPIPDWAYLEVGAIEWLPDQRLAVSSRRGDIVMFHDVLKSEASEITASLYASGLHEVLGLAWREDGLYATQRGEVTRLLDENLDGKADRFDTVSDGWQINGDYHEYAFGSKFDAQGNIWIVLCLTGSFTSDNPYRGWAVRVAADGTMTPTCSGLRSPGGVGFNAEGDVFYTDNQGPWNGTCALKHLRPGSFQGNPEGNRWYSMTEALGARPADPVSGSRIMVEADRIPELEPPAVLFPYKKMGQSASGIACDTTGGFGPFRNQLFVGDQTFSTVMRVSLEKVQGHYQGACFPFLEGFGSGSLALQFAPDGSLFVGGTARGWGSRGGKEYSLDRVRWTGKVPFEVLEMRAKPDGFELTFTEPVDAKTAGDPASYSLPTYTYVYQSGYGSPEVDQVECRIERAEVSEDRRTVRLHVDRLHRGHVHELHLDALRSATGLPLLHPVGYYTLNYIPESE